LVAVVAAVPWTSGCRTRPFDSLRDSPDLSPVLADLAVSEMATQQARDLSTESPADLSSKLDLSTPPDRDLAECVLAANPSLIWVDSANGADDALHGNQLGCAVKTITYGLTRAGTATQFNLAPGTDYTAALGETFPIVLNGTQGIDGDPNATGNRATINGGADFFGNGAPIGINGTNNSVRNLIITGLAGASTNVCVNVHSAAAGPAGHIVDNCDLHDCGGTNAGTGVAVVNGGDSVNVSNCTIHNTLNGIGFFGTTGTAKKNTFATVSGDGVICAASAPGMTGCGETYAADVSTSCVTCVNCATFTAACP
jgi:hypothetical protein